MKRSGMILLILLLIPALVKAYILAENAYRRKQDARKLEGAVSGWYSIAGPAPERIQYLLSPAGKGWGEDLLGAIECERLCNAPESYAAYEIELFLENRAEVSLHMLEVHALAENVYVDNGYLICDKPILPGNFADVSHDQIWLIVKNSPDSESVLQSLQLRIEGETQHGYRHSFGVQKK